MSNKNSNVIFIAGTDTDVGKTICSAAICAYFKQQKKSVAYLKPIETGCEDGVSGDKTFVSQFIEDTYCLYKLKIPISPHLAAKQMGIKISVAEIKSAIKELSSKYQYLVVEGAGGLLVPITDDYDFSNLVSELELNMILVAGSKLGILNLSKLNFEYIRAKNLKILGYVFNQAIRDEKQIEALRTNRQALSEIALKYQIPELFSLPFLDSFPTISAISSFLENTEFSARMPLAN